MKRSPRQDLRQFLLAQHCGWGGDCYQRGAGDPRALVAGQRLPRLLNGPIAKHDGSKRGVGSPKRNYYRQHPMIKSLRLRRGAHNKNRAKAKKDLRNRARYADRELPLAATKWKEKGENQRAYEANRRKKRRGHKEDVVFSKLRCSLH